MCRAHRDGSAAVAGCQNGQLYLWRLGPAPSSKPEKLQTRVAGGISALACSPVNLREVPPLPIPIYIYIYIYPSLVGGDRISGLSSLPERV